MARWPPDSAARLKACALELFAERGFANVTAAEIATAAGMTERTFFRHYGAKEDVLFDDSSGVREMLVAVVSDAAEGSTAAELMQAVADALSERFEAERGELRHYARVVSGEPSLRARALLRDQEWGEAIAEGFRRRGFPPTRARLLGAATGVMFRLVFDEWASDRSNAKLSTRFRAALAGLASDLTSSAP